MYTQPRSATSPRGSRALLAGLILLFALLPSAAFAGGGYTDSGGDSGSASGGGGGGGGGGCVYTTAANGHRVGAGVLSSGVRNTEWGDLRCVNNVTLGSRYKYNREVPGTTGVYAWCISGYEVYRFYGDETNKSKSMTVSRVNTTDWCDAESSYLFPQTTPYDRAPVAGTPLGAPWNVDEAASPNGQIFGEAFGQVTRYKSKLRVAGNRPPLTTGKPFRFTSGSGSPVGCGNVVSAVDPIQRYFTDTSSRYYSAEQAAELRAALAAVYQDEAYAGTELRAPESGLAVINSRGINLPNGPTNAQYNDGVACSSLLDFALFRLTREDPQSVSTTSGVAGRIFERIRLRPPGVTNDMRWVGTCYIPLTRQARQVRFRSGALDWVFPTLQYGGGERYSSFYGHNPRPASFDGEPTPPAPPSPTAKAKYVDASLERPVEDLWRAAMRTDYMRRYNAAIAAGGAGNRPGSPYLKMSGATVAGDANQPLLPGQPYGAAATRYNASLSSPVARGEAYNAVAAAASLADFSRCRHTVQAEVLVPDPDDPNQRVTESTDEPSPTQTITMRTVKALQVGGTRTEQVLGADVGPFNCPIAGTRIIACASEQMSYNYEIKAPEGYNLCDARASSSVPRECDAVLVEGQRSGTYSSSVQVRVRLYRATPPGRPLRLVTTGQQGTYYYTVLEDETVYDEPTLLLAGTAGGTGERIARVISVPRTYSNNPYTPGVVGAPHRLDSPGLKEVPVIGANNT